MSAPKQDWNQTTNPEDGVLSWWAADSSSSHATRQAGPRRRRVLRGDLSTPLTIILVMVALGLIALDRHRRLSLERDRADALARQLEVALALNEGRSPTPSTRSVHLARRPVWGSSASGRNESDSFLVARVPATRSNEPVAFRKDRKPTAWLAEPGPSTISEPRSPAQPASRSDQGHASPLSNLGNLEQSLGRQLVVVAFTRAMGWRINRDLEQRLATESPRELATHLESAWKTWSLLRSAQRLTGWIGNRHQAKPVAEGPIRAAFESVSPAWDQEPWNPPSPIDLSPDHPPAPRPLVVPPKVIERHRLESETDEAPPPPILPPRSIPWPGESAPLNPTPGTSTRR